MAESEQTLAILTEGVLLSRLCTAHSHCVLSSRKPGRWVLALALQKWGSVLQALSFLLLCLGGQEPECCKPRAFSPCSAYIFLEVQGGPQNLLFLPSLPCSASFRICPAQPTGPNQTAWTCLLISEGEQIQCPMTRIKFSSVQSLICVQLFATPWTTAPQASLSITNSRSLLKLMSIELVMPSNHPLSSPSPPAFNLSQHRCLFQ